MTIVRERTGKAVRTTMRKLTEMSSSFARPRARARGRLVLCLAALGIALSACGLFGPKSPPKGTTPAQAPESSVSGDVVRQATPSLPAFAKGVDTTVGTRIGVNSFLWRGALDTVSFMPLVSADAFGGVIITDWYAPPEAPQERFKLNIYILGRELRADAIRVAVFKQKMADGQWQDTTAEQATATDLEDTILTRAEHLRSEALGTGGG